MPVVAHMQAAKKLKTIGFDYNCNFKCSMSKIDAMYRDRNQ